MIPAYVSMSWGSLFALDVGKMCYCSWTRSVFVSFLGRHSCTVDEKCMCSFPTILLFLRMLHELKLCVIIPGQMVSVWATLLVWVEKTHSSPLIQDLSLQPWGIWVISDLDSCWSVAGWVPCIEGACSFLSWSILRDAPCCWELCC